MQLYTINTGFFKLDGGAMFGVVPKSIWQRTNPADEKNLCTWAMRCLLVQDGKRLVLIDTGIGTKQDARFFSFYDLHGEATLLSSLGELGFRPSDITDVFLTHLHFDHVGGAVKALKPSEDVYAPTFPNAVYHVSERQWATAMAPNPRERASFLRENLLPLEESGVLNFLKEGSSSLFEGFDYLTVDGHTEAMLLPKLNYKGQTIVYAADLIPSVAHVPVNYVMGYDVRPLTTMAEKGDILRAAEEDNWLFFYEHDPVNELSSVVKTERGIRAGEPMKLSEL